MVYGCYGSFLTLRKHAHMIYSNFFRSKIDNFQRIFFFYSFLIFAQNIDCGYTLEPPRRGGSNEYPQSVFWRKNKKNRYTPAYPSFAIKMWGSRGYTLHGRVFLMKRLTCYGLLVYRIMVFTTRCDFLSHTGYSQSAVYKNRCFAEHLAYYL